MVRQWTSRVTGNTLTIDVVDHVVAVTLLGNPQQQVRALLRYHDFSRWFLPLKGEAMAGWGACLVLAKDVGGGTDIQGKGMHVVMKEIFWGTPS